MLETGQGEKVSQVEVEVEVEVASLVSGGFTRNVSDRKNIVFYWLFRTAAVEEAIY